MKSDSNVIQPIIGTPMKLTIMGCHFYGNPFHSAKEWSHFNEIGKLWQRFIKVSEKFHFLMRNITPTPTISYEIHYEPDDYHKTSQYHVYVGFHVQEYDHIPLDFNLKPFPEVQYAELTGKVTDHKTTEFFLGKWLQDKSTGYEQAYPYIIQRYDATTFKGMENPESEMTWMVPVVKT